VVYDVPDIRPFLAALHRAAREVVVECGPDHPRSGLRELFRALHGLERPSGPTAEDLIEIVADVAGGRPEVARRTTRRGLRFADRAELLTFYRIRLALPEERTPELEERLDPEIREEGGWLTVGHGVRETVTIWWTT
jgi:hypothetical protein